MKTYGIILYQKFSIEGKDLNLFIILKLLFKEFRKYYIWILGIVCGFSEEDHEIVKYEIELYKQKYPNEKPKF